MPTMKSTFFLGELCVHFSCECKFLPHLLHTHTHLSICVYLKIMLKEISQEIILKFVTYICTRHAMQITGGGGEARRGQASTRWQRMTVIELLSSASLLQNVENILLLLLLLLLQLNTVKTSSVCVSVWQKGRTLGNIVNVHQLYCVDDALLLCML